MRPKLIAAACIAASLLSPIGLQKPRAQSAEQARVIVKYKADAPLMHAQALTAAGKRLSQMQTLGQRIGTALTAGSEISDRMHVVHARGMTSDELAAKLSADSEVEYAVPDGRKHIVAVPNDPFYATRPYNNTASAPSGGPLVGQWYLKTPGPAGTPANTAPSAINAEAAWDLTTGSSSIVVADLDTGLRFDHPDLQGRNVFPGYDMLSVDPDGTYTTANDGDGRDADAGDPGDWVDVATSNCGVEPSSWHGTQTLGLIGATTDNGIGMASVGRSVSVMPVRVLGRCGGFDSDIIAGMLWAAGVSRPADVAFDNPTPARVLNMSLGESGKVCSKAFQDAVNQVVAKGSVIVVAGGNGAGHLVGSPGNCLGVIAVTAVRHVGDKVGFSDLGPEIAISAPGGNCINIDGSACLYPIVTTSNSGKTVPVPGAVGAIYTDSFNSSIGTSFATPLVAGTVALMLSRQPLMTPAQVKAALQASAAKFPIDGGTAGISQCVAPTASSADQLECYCTKLTCGAGMLDTHAAVVLAAATLARIGVATPAPIALAPVMLNSLSVVGAGASITKYVWAITDPGTTNASITGGQGTPSVVVTPAAAGTFAVSLTTTDSLGNVSVATSSVSVAAAAVPATSSSSGGGAVGVGWLALLLGAIGSLGAIDRHERRAIRWRSARRFALRADTEAVP
ncbi:MAG: S8 family peptidase [Pseudomonadota bacterium]|nr:S8 family peptidase [Pseudomonadota bacterium]